MAYSKEEIKKELDNFAKFAYDNGISIHKTLIELYLSKK